MQFSSSGRENPQNISMLITTDVLIFCAHCKGMEYLGRSLWMTCQMIIKCILFFIKNARILLSAVLIDPRKIHDDLDEVDIYHFESGITE